MEEAAAWAAPSGGSIPEGHGQERIRGELGWRAIHEALLGLAKRKASYDAQEARWLVLGKRASLHRKLGYGSFFEYVERIFGYTPKVAAERIRVAETLETLPETSRALVSNELNWSQARELTRVATAETESEWLGAATARTVREVEQMVSGHKPGDRPTDPADDAARRHVLRLEVSAQTLGLFRDATSKLTQEAGHHLSDDDLMQLMARTVLASATNSPAAEGAAAEADAGRSNYQIAVTVCERCGRGEQEAGADSLPISAEAVEAARCDAQIVPTIAPHVGERPARASQTIPPATRRLVLRRHRNRCAVPGCRHRTFIDLHHIDRRADGGGHDPERLIALCGAHHQAEHEGRLRIEGTASEGFRFSHADGTTYGAKIQAQSADHYASAFSALKHLGFKEGQARQALDAARPHLGADSSLEYVVQEALRQVPTLREAVAGYGRAA